MVWLSCRVFAVVALKFHDRDGGKEARTDVIRGRCSATERDFAGRMACDPGAKGAATGDDSSAAGTLWGCLGRAAGRLAKRVPPN